MTTLSLSSFSLFTRTARKADQMADDTDTFDRAEQRKFVAEMISAGACDSEYGVQMLMAVYPGRF